MRMRFAALGVCVVLAACGQPTEKAKAPAASEAAAPKPSAPATPAAPAWAGLETLVGKYPQDFLESSPLTADLKALLGDKFAVLKINTQTASPLQTEGGVYFFSGNKAHEGGSEEAYVLADPSTRALEVGLRENGRLSVYTTPGAKIAKPKDVQTLLSNAG